MNPTQQLTTPEIEIIAVPVNSKLQAHRQQCEYREFLLRNFIEFVKRTGDFDYPLLNSQRVDGLEPAALGLGDLRPTEEKTKAIAAEDILCQRGTADNPGAEPSEVLKNAVNTLEETVLGITVSTLKLKDILGNLVEVCRPASAGRSLRNFLEQIPPVHDDLPLATALKSEHLKLAGAIDRLLDLAQKYGKPDLEMSGRSVGKLVGDLTYFRLYIEQYAQIAKIQQEIYRASDPSVYLGRLNQYLDVLPEIAAALIHLLQQAIA